jgi:hypothetical protein
MFLDSAIAEEQSEASEVLVERGWDEGRVARVKK